MIAENPFISSDPGSLYRHVIKYRSWSKVKRFKKHKVIDHCGDVCNDLTKFRNKWKGVSGVYKITFRPYRQFTYWGSSVDLGSRFKYHFFNGSKQRSFLG